MSKTVKKFTGPYKRRDFFDRRVRMQGGSRVLSLGKFIPAEWAWVRVTKLMETPKSVELRFEQLELKPADAPTESDNQEGE